MTAVLVTAAIGLGLWFGVRRVLGDLRADLFWVAWCLLVATASALTGRWGYVTLNLIVAVFWLWCFRYDAARERRAR